MSWSVPWLAVVRKAPPDHAGPERVGLPEIQAEIKHTELPCGCCRSVNRAPSAGDEMDDGEEADDRPAYVNERLNNVGPDNGCQAALKRVNERQQAHYGDRDEVTPKLAEPAQFRAEGNADHDRYGVNAHAFRSCARDQKQPCRVSSQLAAEATLDKLVRGEKIAFEVLRQKDDADDHSAQEIAHG